MFLHSKPSANALNEITVTIQLKEGTNYHETFMMDTTKDNTFEYNGFVYSLSAKDAMHYHPSLLAVDRKLAMFFDMHKTLAMFFDWFNFRNRASYELGFLYEEENPDPLTPVNLSGADFALINRHIQDNTSLEGSAQDADNKLKGAKPLNINLLMLAVVIIVAVVAIIVVISYVAGPAQVPQNATFTPTPFIRGP